MSKIFFIGGILLLAACAAGRAVPEGYKPRYSQFVGYKETLLTKAAGRPDAVYYDNYGRRYLVYDTFSMENSIRDGVYACRTMFLTGSGFIKASYFDENRCVRR